MADFSKPLLTDTYTSWQSTLTANIIAALRWLDPATSGTHTNVPTGAYRINGSAIEKYNGASWSAVSLAVSAHTHSASDIASGTLADARLPATMTAKTFSGTLTINRGTNAAEATKDLYMQNGAHELSLLARVGAGAFNSIVQAGDKVLTWNNGAQDTGALSIAPWSSVGCGIRIDAATGKTTVAGGLESASTIADIAGNVRDLAINTQNANYTLALADRGKCVLKNDITAYTWTIPPNSSVAYPIGTMITLRNANASGAVTIARGTGVVLRKAGSGTDANATLGAWGMATLLKEGTDSWVISGTGVS